VAKVSWKKIHVAKPFLEIREGKYRTSYRVRFRQEGLVLEQTLEGDFKNWREAEKEAERLIYEARYGKKPKDTKGIKTESLCDEIVALKKPLSKATFEQTELFMRKHIKPFLRGECAYEEEDGKPCAHRLYLEQGACIYAVDLGVSHYLTYKAHLRLHRPKTSLFNHFKFFGMLYKYAFDRGLLERPIRLEFDEGKEDFRKRGMVISDEDLRDMIAAANRAWRDRILVQRLTGQRPGVIRNLRKAALDFATGVVSIEKQESKNRREYQFVAPRAVLEILRARMDGSSPYFFPSERDPEKPMDKHLNGWRAAIRRANAKRRTEGRAPMPEGYTPHDVRHTRLTELFKTPGINHALTCYQHDLSLEEAMKTYIHLTAEDTRIIAENADARASAFVGAS
jgi:integrase